MDADMKEILDRVRRTETRVTKIGNALSIDVGGGKPTWDARRQRVVMPSQSCSIGEVISAIPMALRDQYVQLFVRDEYLTTLHLKPD